MKNTPTMLEFLFVLVVKLIVGLGWGSLGTPYERDSYLGVPLESQTTNSNQQLSTCWQDVVKWKKIKTIQISPVSAMTKGQWMSLDVTWMIQSTYQAALVTSVLSAKTCVKSPAKKGGCFPSHGYLSMLSISDSQQKLDHFKLLTSSHSLGESAQIPVNI